MNRLLLSGNPLRPTWWASTGRALWYLLAYQFMGWLLFGAALAAATTAAALSITLAGIPLLVAAAGIIHACAQSERSRLRAASGQPVEHRYRGHPAPVVLRAVRSLPARPDRARGAARLLPQRPIRPRRGRRLRRHAAEGAADRAGLPACAGPVQLRPGPDRPYPRRRRPGPAPDAGRPAGTGQGPAPAPRTASFSYRAERTGLPAPPMRVQLTGGARKRPLAPHNCSVRSSHRKRS
jgi:hypothetical protein